jgi:hypothetical protein
VRLHFLVEGLADQAFLEALLPRLIPKHTWRVYPHQGRGRIPGDLAKPPDPSRRTLLDNLPSKLRAFGRSLDPATDRVVVLLDSDDDDCAELLNKLRLTHAAVEPRPTTLYRLAIEELESWFLGDEAAVETTFPKLNRRKLKTWQPDSVGGTWELFQEVIRAQSENKVYWGEAMGAALAVGEPLEERNRSPSYRSFCRRVREHAGEMRQRRA